MGIPPKICKWPVSTWKGVQHHQSLGKCKSKPPWAVASHPLSRRQVTASIGKDVQKLAPRYSSVQFSRLVESDSLQPHEPQHARPPCPSPTPGVHPNPCPSSQWCHPIISSSVIPFSSCPQSFPASGSFQMSQLFASQIQPTGTYSMTKCPPMDESTNKTQHAHMQWIQS